MLLLPVLQECFATSRRKQDFELRIEQLRLQLQDVANEMQTLIAQLRQDFPASYSRQRHCATGMAISRGAQRDLA